MSKRNHRVPKAERASATTPVPFGWNRSARRLRQHRPAMYAQLAGMNWTPDPAPYVEHRGRVTDSEVFLAKHV